MLSPSPGPVRIPGYDLREPSEDDAREALRRVFGAERGAERWAGACREAGVPVGRVRNTDMLRKVAESLAAQGGASASVARSIEIRIRTYARLAARAGGQP